MIHIAANHSLFSCLYAPQNSPISSNGRRLLYIAQNAIAFSLSQMLNSALYFAELDNIMGASTLLDIFVVNPLIISVVLIHLLIHSTTYSFIYSHTSYSLRDRSLKYYGLVHVSKTCIYSVNIPCFISGYKF